jgi:hypothetical protein
MVADIGIDEVSRPLALVVHGITHKPNQYISVCKRPEF